MKAGEEDAALGVLSDRDLAPFALRNRFGQQEVSELLLVDLRV